MLLNVFWNTEGQNLRKENSYLFSGKKMTKVLKTNVDLQPDLLLSLCSGERRVSVTSTLQLRNRSVQSHRVHRVYLDLSVYDPG